jgi:hypothetical protein
MATASRIYKVTVCQFNSKNTTHELIRATSRAQAERYVCRRYVSSCVASQDDIIDGVSNGIEDARKEAPVDGQD